MKRKIFFGLLWLGVVVYAFFLAPPNQPNTTELIINLSTGKWEGINPFIVSLFNIMGIWPMIYACVMLIDGRGQKVRAWPFVIFSFAVGAFAILPYLALRDKNPNFTGSKNLLLKLLDSRWTGVIISVPALLFLGYGLLYGNWSDFVLSWQSSRFIHVMSLDFCLLCLLFPALLQDDLSRRGLNNSTVFWLVTLIPFIGPLAYISLRSPLKETDSQQVEATSATPLNS